MNQVRCILLYIVLLTAFVHSACRKTNAEKPSPVKQEYDVITTGSIYNETLQIYEAYYWKNTERFLLPAADTRQAFPYGLDKVGETIYVAGGYEGEHPATGESILLPCYWKDGQKINLPVQGLNIIQRCGAADIKVVNNILYVLGDIDMRPLVWRIAGGETTLIEFPFHDSVTDVRRGANMEVYDGKIFIAGNQKIKHTSREIFNVGYWVIGQGDQPVFNIIEEELAYALCFAITVSEHGIFITGEYHETDTVRSKPGVWSINGRVPVTDALHPSYNRLRGIVSGKNGVLYTILHDIQLYQPVLWKLSLMQNIETIKPQVPVNAKGLCETVDVIDENLAYSYIYHHENTWKGFFVFNDKQQELNINNSSFASFSRTRIF